MAIEEEIKRRLERVFRPVHLDVINESDRHIGHGGHDGSGQSHFKLIIVSKLFDGQSRIARHRLVYEALNDLFSKGLHALSMKTLTPDEHMDTR